MLPCRKRKTIDTGDSFAVIGVKTLSGVRYTSRSLWRGGRPHVRHPGEDSMYLAVTEILYGDTPAV